MKQENAKGVKCPRCGNERVVKCEIKRAKGNVASSVTIRYQCRNSNCMYKFTPTTLKTSETGKKHVTGKTLVDVDKSRGAKLPGKRLVKHYDDEGNLASTSIYYERRRNRADINPKRGL